METNGNKTSWGYRELAEKMWFKEKNGKELEISHVGNDETLKKNFYLTLSLDKWLNDKRWEKVRSPLQFQEIELEYHKSDNIIEIVSKHIDILTVDKRAMYILAIELAKDLGGRISDTDLDNWESVEIFENKHKEILCLTFDEASNLSLREVSLIEVQEEPWD
ncbi:hypothetical protein I6N96_10920 [Enterococcus sp. BWM-S5]|uniref:Uncharacterized protein n=1 Tax=Enterococcus larvae TaxID=2794352 RepID=A0ABS4CKQ7_9ENTE|nr:hypothetical protein [Enterococcus larvae]MBP1046778.1 hypothetical protein [Enterococcus larvae]